MESYYINRNQGFDWNSRSVQKATEAVGNTYSNTRSRGRGYRGRGRGKRGRWEYGCGRGAQTQRGYVSKSREDLRDDWASGDDESFGVSDSESVYSVESRLSKHRKGRGNYPPSWSGTSDEELDDEYRPIHVPGRRKRYQSTLSIADNEKIFTEEDIFRNLLKSVGGISSVAQFMADFVPSHLQCEFKQWLKRRREQISVYKRRQTPMYIGPLLKKATLCFDHMENPECSRSNCYHFHICKFYLNGICRRGMRCRKGHDLKDDGHNEQLIENLGLEDFSDKEIMAAILCRYPQVCRAQTCSNKEDCPYLHICYNFIVNRCTNEDCERGHSFETPHNKWVLKAYRMQQWPREKLILLKALINMPRNQKPVKYNGENPEQGYNTDTMTDEEPKPQYKPVIQPKQSLLKEQSLTTSSSVNNDDAHQKDICLSKLTGICLERHCDNHHTDLPYLWQIQIFGRWVCFDNNQMLEQWYCNLEESARGKVSLFGDEWDITLHFEKWHGTCTKGLSQGPLTIRRLSTASFGKETGSPPGGSFHTQWRWYFRNDYHQWMLFDKDELQHTLEKKYTTGQKSYLFTRESHKFKYRISFTEWTQKNIDTGKDRKILRRPVYTSFQEVRLKQFPRTLHVSSTDPHPLEWNALDLAHEFELVELEETQKEFASVKSEFFATLKEKNFKICNIYRIQNLALWNEYKMKRLNLEKIHAKKAGSLEERSLFHGTDSYDTCYGICTNNFDFRLSGKNATVYGKGSYFAVSSQYSHNYTKGPTRLMFRAKVLVGSYTVGKPEMTCPPMIPGEGHRRYDTCVNNITNPSIFVVFDRNQCYPEHLIAYRERDNVETATEKLIQLTALSKVNPQSSGHKSHAQSHAAYRYNPSQTTNAASINPTAQSTMSTYQSLVAQSAGSGTKTSTSNSTFPGMASPSAHQSAASNVSSPRSARVFAGYVSSPVTAATPHSPTNVVRASSVDVDVLYNSGSTLSRPQRNISNDNSPRNLVKKKKDTCTIQ